MKTRAWKVLILFVTLAGMAAAADTDPERGVARVSLMNGDVSVHRGDSGDWVAAAVNAPLVVDDTLATGVNSRAEVQFDWANMIRVAPESEIRLAVLENQRYTVQVARGLVTFRVERDSSADVEISTPSVSVRPLKKGSYRVYVRDDGESEITVRSGEAEVFTPTGSQSLKSGRTMLARGDASNPEFQIVAAVGRDEWDRWNDERDSSLARASDDYRYVNHSVYGVEDLDGYGSWMYVAPYGYVWSPTVAAGWSPYYYGRWSWIDWYGWSWVSYDPWGWAPYHYGRWFYQGSRWCWWPGGLYTRHYWSPGLVAFFGYGGVGVGVGFGNVGWVPLAPYEPYYPWYGRRYYGGFRNGAYIDNSVHIVNNTNIVNIYKNARVNSGIVAVNGSEFGRGGATHLRVNRGDLSKVGLVRGQLPVVPNRDSQFVSDRRTNVTPPRGTLNNREFFSRRPAPTVERVPFAEQQRGMEQVARRTFGEEPVRSAGGARSGAAAAPARDATPARGMANETTRTAPAARNETPARGQANEMTRTAPAARNETPARGQASELRTAPARTGVQDAGSGGGWRRFGSSTPARVSPNASETARPSARPAAEPRTAESPRTAPAPSAAPRESNSNWQRFETNRDAAPAPPRAERSNPAPRQSEAPRVSEPSRVAPQAAPEQRSEPIRISPPIVREREAPSRTQTPRAAPYAPSGGGGSVRSAPSYGGGSVRSAPSGGSVRSAPSYGGGSVRSAPSYGGGSVRSAPSGGSMRSAPAPRSSGAVRSAPSGGSSRSAPSGGGRVSPGGRRR